MGGGKLPAVLIFHTYSMNKLLAMKTIQILLLGVILGAVPTAFATSAMFSDVSEGEWYFEAIENLAELGIVEGYEDGTYLPSNEVNRAEMAVMLDRLIDTLKNNACVYEENIYFEGDEIDKGDSSCSCYDGEIQMCTGETGPSDLE